MATKNSTEKKPKPTALEYSGNMTCIVNNQSGGPITDVSVSHQWKGITNTYGPTSLNTGANGSFEIQVGSGGSDEWSVRWTDADGQCWYRSDKQCDVYDEDLNSGKPVNVNLINGDQGFSVEMPVSSSCNDNYVSSCS